MTAPTPKVKTIKQIEEGLTKSQKKTFESMWKHGEGSPCLVAESDKRPALKPKAEDFFKAITDGEEDDETE
jgi:hypothetical protein